MQWRFEVAGVLILKVCAALPCVILVERGHFLRNLVQPNAHCFSKALYCEDDFRKKKVAD